MTSEIRTAMTWVPAAKLLHPQHVRLRAGLDGEQVEDMREFLQEDGKADLPPVLAFFDGSRHWIADGEHTARAYQELGKQVPCDVRKGSRQDAILEGLKRHRTALGVRWGRKDCRHAALLLLSDPELRRMNNCDIARTVGYRSESTVRLLRTYVQEQEEAAKEAERKKAMSLNSEIAPKPAPKPAAKPTFQDEPEEETPQVETRKVEVKRGPNKGRVYDYPVKPKKDLPDRYTATKSRRQLLRTVPKLERQVDSAGLDLVQVYERLLAAAKKGISGKRALEDYFEEVGE